MWWTTRRSCGWYNTMNLRKLKTSWRRRSNKTRSPSSAFKTLWLSCVCEPTVLGLFTISFVYGLMLCFFWFVFVLDPIRMSRTSPRRSTNWRTQQHPFKTDRKLICGGHVYLCWWVLCTNVCIKTSEWEAQYCFCIFSQAPKGSVGHHWPPLAPRSVFAHLFQPAESLGLSCRAVCCFSLRFIH